MGAAIAQRSPSFSTPMALSDHTLSNKTTSENTDLAQSFSQSQTSAGPKFSIQQLVSLCTARKSFAKIHQLRYSRAEHHPLVLSTQRVFPRCVLQVSLHQARSWSALAAGGWTNSSAAISPAPGELLPQVASSEDATGELAGCRDSSGDLGTSYPTAGAHLTPLAPPSLREHPTLPAPNASAEQGSWFCVFGR